MNLSLQNGKPFLCMFGPCKVGNLVLHKFHFRIFTIKGAILRTKNMILAMTVDMITPTRLSYNFDSF